jgi:hypothetical protein
VPEAPWEGPSNHTQVRAGSPVSNEPGCGCVHFLMDSVIPETYTNATVIALIEEGLFHEWPSATCIAGGGSPAFPS